VCNGQRALTVEHQVGCSNREGGRRYYTGRGKRSTLQDRKRGERGLAAPSCCDYFNSKIPMIRLSIEKIFNALIKSYHVSRDLGE